MKYKKIKKVAYQVRIHKSDLEIGIRRDGHGSVRIIEL